MVWRVVNLVLKPRREARHNIVSTDYGGTISETALGMCDMGGVGKGWVAFSDMTTRHCH